MVEIRDMVQLSFLYVCPGMDMWDCLSMILSRILYSNNKYHSIMSNKESVLSNDYPFELYHMLIRLRTSVIGRDDFSETTADIRVVRLSIRMVDHKSK
jgi:hypothetical protein